mgnify:CR=1 FL=1
MKKIINPWKGLEGYNCFGCAPDNEVGVKMEFYEDGDEVSGTLVLNIRVGLIHCMVVFRLYCWMKFVLGRYFVSCRQQGLPPKWRLAIGGQLIRKTRMSYCVRPLKR